MKMKKLFAILITLVLIVGMLPISAFAENDPAPAPVSKIKTRLFVKTGPTVIDPSESAAFALIPLTEDEQPLPAGTVKESDLTLPPQATLDLDGEYNTVVVEIPASALSPGENTLSLGWSGDETYEGCSATVTFTVANKQSLQLVDYAATLGKPGEPYTISGRFMDGNNQPLANTEITIRTQQEPGSTSMLPWFVTTDATGCFSYTVSQNLSCIHEGDTLDVELIVHATDAYLRFEKKDQLRFETAAAVSVTGSIDWDDGDNIDGRRPERTWLMLRRKDGEPVVDMDGNSVTDLVEIAGTKGTKLSATWEDLPTHADIGGGRTQRVSYEVVEADQDGAVWTPAGYEKLTSGDMESGFVITNRYIPKQTDIVVNKVWEDNDNAGRKRPESVTLHLDQKPFVSAGDDDIKDVAAAVTAGKAGGWKALWQGLPYNGKKSGQFTGPIVYKVREDTPAGYTSSVTQTDAGLRASIVWADGVNEEDKPALITATLINEAGDATSRIATLSAANNWTCAFDGLSPNQAASNTVSLFPGLQPELGYLQLSVIREYTLTNTLIPTVVTIDVPKCGTVVDEDHSYPFNPATGEYDPAAQSNRPVGTILTNGWEFVKSTDDPSVDWLKWGPFTGWNNHLTMAFPITLTGGSSYNALGRIIPAGGASVPSDIGIIVNGQELPRDRVKVDNGSIYFAASIIAEHTLEKQARVEPTCTATGTEEHWKCTACGKLYSDENGENEIAEPVAIDALDHDWGEWVVTKEATETGEGVETRKCKHDASHTETRPIPKLDPTNVSYRNIAGGGGEWTKGSKNTLGFTFKRSVDDGGTYELFTGIKIDGKSVTEKDASGKENWTAKSGSVIIDLQPSFLETLSVGKHTLTTEFEDGSATAEFTIKAAKKDDEGSGGNAGVSAKTTATAGKTTTTAAKTGDGSNALLWILLMAVSMGVMLFVGNRRRHTR